MNACQVNLCEHCGRPYDEVCEQCLIARDLDEGDERPFDVCGNCGNQLEPDEDEPRRFGKCWICGHLNGVSQVAYLVEGKTVFTQTYHDLL